MALFLFQRRWTNSAILGITAFSKQEDVLLISFKGMAGPRPFSI